MFSPELEAAAFQLITQFGADGKKIAIAESCTGGLLGGLLTSVAGSSKVLDRGFITYSNEAKSELLGVDPALIETHGAVSASVVAAMATGALRKSHADVALAITGIAGPDGGTDDKPIGLVYFGIACHDTPVQVQRRRFGEIGRSGIRHAALQVALEMFSEIKKGSR